MRVRASIVSDVPMDPEIDEAVRALRLFGWRRLVPMSSIGEARYSGRGSDRSGNIIGLRYDPVQGLTW